MTDQEILARATEAAAKIAAFNKEREEMLALGEHHTAEGRKSIARAQECKRQASEWTVALQQLNVQRSVVSAEQSAKAAQSAAEETLKRLTDKEKQLDELIQKNSTPKE